MASAEDVKHQQTLLTTYRRNLAHYLRQQAALGEAYAPPAILNGILEAQSNIQRIKQILRGWNILVEDHPDDGDNISSVQTGQEPKAVTTNVDRIKLRQILINYFSDDELRDLVFDMNLDYEALPGASKAGKARELIAFAERHNRFQDLVELAQRLRPNVAW
jgi:hypothetical protein